RLGTYEIVELLGKGGMGEVYRATDSELRRDVAIKVLPSHLTEDSEQLSRLRREARALAALNHPGIATVHGFHEHDGTRYIVMELVDGETLAEHLRDGCLPVAQALGLATQIARALEAAHERGIVHRDLKPANIKVTTDGSAKVLDFGLAMALGQGGARDQAESPTLTMATQAGVILGTAGYMSPEQARGQEVDRRTDIWALGVVLLEMLTGKRTFAGEFVTDTLAAVIKDEPDLDHLPADASPALRRILERCLHKEPAERFHDVADVRILLADAAQESPVATYQASEPASMWPRSWRDAMAAALIAVVALGAGAGAMRFMGSASTAPADSVPTRRVVLEHGDHRDSRPNLAPDGQRLAYGFNGQIWIRDLRGLEAVPVAGTEGGAVPFWSPDGAWLGFSAEGSMWKVRTDGGGRTLITTTAPGSTAGGAAWLADGRIVFDTGSSEVLVVSDRGGEAATYVPLQEGEVDFHYLVALPDGRGVLTIPHRSDDRFDSIQLITPDGKRREILTLGDQISDFDYSPTGHIVFTWFAPLREGLWAVEFSLEDLEVVGDPFPVALDGTAPTIADDGTMVYVVRAPQVQSEIVYVDRTGAIVARIDEPRRGIYPAPVVSPDGQTVAVPVRTGQGMDLWVYDLRGGAPRRLTFESALRVTAPMWMPDGERLLFAMFGNDGTDDFGLFGIDAAGGTPELVAARSALRACDKITT
ncbi:MAG: protein kinase, partial [Thermoanaerobaculales bacterium]